MKIRELLEGIECQTRGDDRLEVTGIAYHSQRVKPGDLFVAINGFKTEGSRFLDEAVKRGAVAVAAPLKYEHPVFQIETESPRRFLAQVSRRFYGYPDKRLILVGITGTNGKTTTAYLVKSILEACNKRTGLVGTIGHYDGARWIEATNTTPESLDLTRLFSTMVKNRVEFSVLEVSSHALALDRVYGLDFKVAVFTNLSRDHLDFHKSFEDYGEAKSRLFSTLRAESFAIINQDDPFGETIKTRAQKVFYSLEKRGEVTGRILELTRDRSRILVSLSGSELELELPLVGRHNAYNLLAACGVAYVLGIPTNAIRDGVYNMRPISGRLELVADNIYIDYAHTPDAIKSLILTAKEFTKGRVIIIFGCGGDRDREKRPLMGRLATELADYVIITSDNPRTEDPMGIIEEVRSGVERNNYEIAIDRFGAIKRALEMARPDDTVLIAGKGHEAYQILGEERRPFSDRAVVEEILRCSASKR